MESLLLDEPLPVGSGDADAKKLAAERQARFFAGVKKDLEDHADYNDLINGIRKAPWLKEHAPLMRELGMATATPVAEERFRRCICRLGRGICQNEARPSRWVCWPCENLVGAVCGCHCPGCIPAPWDEELAVSPPVPDWGVE